MIYTFFEIFTVIFELLLVHIFFSWWFGYRNIKRPKIALYLVIYFLLRTTITLLPVTPAIRAIVSFFFILGIVAILFETTRPSAIYGALLFLALGVLSEYLGQLILYSFSFDTEALISPGYARMIFIALGLSIRFITVLIAASILRKNRAALSFKQVVPIFPCFVVSIYICIVFFIIFPYLDDSMAAALAVAIVGLLYVCGIIIFNTQSIKTTTLEIEEQKLAQKHYEMQAQYYQNVMADREETRALWHDLKKHFTALEALVEANDIKSAKHEYIELNKALKNLGNVVVTENTALSAILQHNIDKAKAAGAAVSLDVRVSPKFTFSAVDLSVIIGNTFDNAIEECVSLKELKPQIEVSIVERNHMLLYNITNPCSPQPQKKAGNIRGYGLKNVRRCVEKHSGFMQHGKSDDKYSVTIRLNWSE